MMPRETLQVGSVAEAKAAHRRDAQALVVQGSEADGHNRAGAATFSLLPAVIDAVEAIPVIAAGGIADGQTVTAALALGAEANLDAEGENALNRAIQLLRHNKCIVIVISHRPSALSALNMAMILYEGRAIAFGPREEIFARVSAAAPAEPVAAASTKTALKAPVAEGV
jgi:hypothetical protein